MEYAKERYEAVVPVEDYVKDCVNVPEFLEYCRQCGNYNKMWSCPEFDFEPEDYWREYRTFRIIGIKILVPEDMREKTWTREERGRLMEEMLWKEKERLTEELFSMEKEYPGSISLSAGSCMRCGAGKCTRREGAPCRHPERLRYSIEALGGNVGLTVTKYLKQELQWMEEGKMPEHFMLVCGLLLR